MGSQFSASCSAAVPDSLQAMVEAAILSPNGTEIAVASGMDTATATVRFPALQPSDFGEYICRITITSPFLSQPYTTNEPFEIGKQFTMDLHLK